MAALTIDFPLKLILSDNCYVFVIKGFAGFARYSLDVVDFSEALYGATSGAMP
jgi:hypothetical protein